jgi:hypothetical protein
MSLRKTQGENVEAEVRRSSDGTVTVSGHMTKYAGMKQNIRWMAPQKPHRTMGFNGSGLPYHDADQAFENTPHKGVIESPDGSFSLLMPTLPSAYYTGLGSVYVPPVLMLETAVVGQENLTYRTHVFLSPEGVPYRWIAGSPPGPRVAPSENEVGRAMYYSGREDLGLFQNQEAILRYKGYPCQEVAQELPDRVDANPWLNTPAPA